jgi:hypothetical protein
MRPLSRIANPMIGPGITVVIVKVTLNSWHVVRGSAPEEHIDLDPISHA